jgi:O-antigen/teichoic acid export membrane protein
MNKYFRAISANFFFFAISTIFFLLITAVAIRVMGDELYGLWVILNAILLFSGIGMLGMGIVVSKFASEAGELALSHNSIISSAILILLPMAGLVVLVLFLTRGWIATKLGLTAELHQQFRLALVLTALSIIPQFFGRVPHGYLLSQLKNNLARAVELGINISLWSGAVLIAYFSKNLVWMALWALIVQTAGMVVLFTIIVPMVNFKWQVEVAVLQRMLSFSIFSFIESLAITFFQQFDRILVGFVLGPVATGIYSVGTSVGLRLSIITGQATEIMIPYASQKDTSQNKTELYNTFRVLLRVSSLLLGLIASILIVFMNEILAIWISASYSETYTTIFQILVIGYAWLSLSRPGHQTLTGIGKVRFTALVYLITTLMMLSGLYFLTIRFGLIGSAFANLIMFFLIIFNLFSHTQLTREASLKGILGDLAWGVGIPPFSLWLVSFPAVSISLKLAYIMLMTGIVFIILWRDIFVQKHFFGKLKLYFRPHL